MSSKRASATVPPKKKKKKKPRDLLGAHEELIAEVVVKIRVRLNGSVMMHKRCPR